jgi:hypothetical protein
MVKRVLNLLALPLHIVRSPAGRIFWISFACWLVSFSFCRYQFSRDPNSAFFDVLGKQYGFKYSKHRAKQGLDYLHTLADSSEERHASSHPEVCAAFVTVKREGEQYIDAAIGSMLQPLTDWERSRLSLHVLFADTYPDTHPTWTQPWLRNAVNWVGTYNASVEEEQYLTGLVNQQLFAEKGV